MNIDSRVVSDLSRDIFIFKDENDSNSQLERVFPTTSIDQVFDYLDLGEPKSLRQILNDLKVELLSGGTGVINFPVTSVNGLTGDVNITKALIGLNKVDNTDDYNKPLSIPQRHAIMDILANYNFRTNLDTIYDHLSDFNNPHHITISQLNINGELNDAVQDLINSHNINRTNSHIDIRNNLTTLWNYYDYLNKSIDLRINRAITVSEDHLNNVEAHSELFNVKEDKVNKVGEITSNYNYTEYPSTRAVVEFVNSKISEYNTNLNLDLPFISEIRIINTSDNLPSPGQSYKKIIYVIKENTSTPEVSIAVCRKVNDSWSWDIKPTGAISKLSSRYFSTLESEVTLNLSNIYDDMITLSDNGFSLSAILSHYYTRTEMDNRYLRDLTIVPGVDDGTIRYYKNGDESTSQRVYIKGLNDCAFLDKIDENHILPQSINEGHIIPSAVNRSALKRNAVNYTKIECRPLHVLGNLSSTLSNGQEISLVELADILRPIIGGWPDPNNPANPWNNYFNDMKVSPHLWDPGVEVNLADESFGMRFTGTISCIPNYQFSKILSSRINLDSADLIDAGGTWVFSSDPKKKTILGGSNLTGHTFGTVNIDEDALYFDSISIGDRVDAEYDIWVRYTKTGVVTEGPDYLFNFNDYGWEEQNYVFERSYEDLLDPVDELPVLESFNNVNNIYFAENSLLNVSI